MNAHVFPGHSQFSHRWFRILLPFRFAFGLLLFSMLFQTLSCQRPEDQIPRIIVTSDTKASLDHRLFGQFLEKPSWHGEWGPEAALEPGTHQLQEGVMDLMREMHIPVLRFPGGTDVNQHDWTTTIDNVPGREGGRPLFIGKNGDTVSQEFGYDEALRLAEALGSEMIIVPNFGDAYFGRKPVEEALLHEAGLVAYCNLPVGAELPEGMPDWPSVRAANGHPEPYGVRYVQICNEPWVMDRDLKMGRGEIPPEKAARYLDLVVAFVEAFAEIDPQVEFIIDGNSADIALPVRDLLGDRVHYTAFHTYMPWGIREVWRGDTLVPAETLSEEEKWLAWASTPRFNDEGHAVFPRFNPEKRDEEGRVHPMLELDYPIAVTEWNWNGWWGTDSVDPDKLGSDFNKGVGAAGFLHAFMRESGRIKMGIQSMLVGNSWGITGIRVSPTGAFPPYPLPTGMVTGLYSKYHGDRVLETREEGIPSFEQPYRMSGIQPAKKVAYLDILATDDESAIYLHVINRHFTDDLSFRVETEGWSTAGSPVQRISMVKNPDRTQRTQPAAVITETGFEPGRSALVLEAPKQSVSVFVIGKR